MKKMFFGSIGVIMQVPNFTRVAGWAGVEITWSREQFALSARLDLADAVAWAACRPGDQVRVTLGGVARKTANIVLSNALGINIGIAVDTHVRRLSYRLGLTTSENPVIIEKDLMPLFAPEAYGEINHLLVLFGREVCKARRPRCGDCVLNDVCPKHGV